MYCKADFKSIAKCKKWLCAAVFSLFLKNMRRAANLVLQSRCKAILAPPQSTPKNTKTGRKSVGFLILTQAPKCTRSHCFPPQKHPKNGFVMRFAGKNSFLQVRSAHVLILSALSHRCPLIPTLLATILLMSMRIFSVAIKIRFVVALRAAYLIQFCHEDSSPFGRYVGLW